MLVNALWDFYDILIIGCKDKKQIARYEDDMDMYNSCDIVINMFDSTYWEVFSMDEHLIYSLGKKFKDVKYITDLPFIKPSTPNPHQHRWLKTSSNEIMQRGIAEPVPEWEY